MPKEWYLIKDGYFSGFEQELFDDAQLAFEDLLYISPEAFSVDVNRERQERAIVQSISHADKRSILFKEDAINWGDLIGFDGGEWLVIDKPINNQSYSKSRIHFCNSNLHIQKTVGERIEYDPLNNPYKVGEKIIEFNQPCIIESMTSLDNKDSKPINLPSGDMYITIQNTNHELISIGEKFNMFGDVYRISGIDRSRIYGEKGVITLITVRDIKE